MSLRGDILGWVINQLNGMDAADPVARGALYEALCQQVGREGAFGAPPSEAFPHLESAIARQEMYWLRETGLSAELSPPPSIEASEPEVPQPAARADWHWPDRLKLPDGPPGPAPGPAEGPFADHVYETLTLVTPAGPAPLEVNWMLDPACQLEASCADIGFRFKTRASSLPHAIAHLEAVLEAGGLALPDALRRLRGEAR
ncbi:MAG: hypothetical protein B7X53_13985 [Hyphomonas sp. 34-62-18]|nr:hypothetical protein [Hyphomonas sp. 34-62-18]OYW85036.1 MAG: hypothetical protein B7Z22_09355 [Hyphomonas sp. 32-62-5]OZB14382.1 MAG: hypothetical protein B7X53_13985 [Hyphomonas sp. 34-62-18]